MERNEIQNAILHEGVPDDERLEAIGCLISQYTVIPKIYWIVACRWLYRRFAKLHERRRPMEDAASYNCPSCLETLAVKRQKKMVKCKFCSECGQAIDWSEVK